MNSSTVNQVATEEREIKKYTYAEKVEQQKDVLRKQKKHTEIPKLEADHVRFNDKLSKSRKIAVECDSRLPSSFQQNNEGFNLMNKVAEDQQKVIKDKTKVKKEVHFESKTYFPEKTNNKPLAGKQGVGYCC